VYILHRPKRLTAGFSINLNFQDVMTSKLKNLDVRVQNLEVMQWPTRKLKQKLNAKQFLGPTTYASLTHQQHRLWFLRATAMLYSASMARLSSVCQSLRRSFVTDVVKRCEIGPRLLLMTDRKSHIGFQMT